jgi:hypothetical protein
VPAATAGLATPAPARRIDAVAWTFGVLVVGALLSWARLPWSARKLVWAEDGSFFLTDSDQLGTMDTLLKPYMGYLHLVPRAVVGLVGHFGNLAYLADQIALVCCLIVGAVAALVFHCSSAVTDWRAARLALASVAVLVPTAPLEVLGNTANLHWYLLWASVWLLLYTPRSWLGSIGLGLVALAIALTEILTGFLAPLVFYRFRSARMWPVRIGYGLGLLLQVHATLVSPRDTGASPPGLASTVEGYFLQAVTTIFFAQDKTAGEVLARTGWWIGLVLAVPALLSWVYVLVRGRSVTRVASTALALLSVLVWVFAFRGVSGGPDWEYADFGTSEFTSFAIVRYSVLCSMCLIALPLLAAVELRRRAQLRAATVVVAPGRLAAVRRYRRLSAALVGVIPLAVVCVMLANFTPEVTRRSGVPVWSTSVAAARAQCEVQRGRGSIDLPVAPGGDWVATLSCATLDRWDD